MQTLTPAELDVLRRFDAALRAALPGIVRETRLFGSRARGEARPDSDWDVAVLVSAERVDDLAVHDAVSDAAFEFLMQGWPIHGVVMGAASVGPDAERRADAFGDVARNGVPIG